MNISDIVQFLENNEAIDFNNLNKELLKQKSDDGWNLIQLAAYYDNKEILNYCLDNMSFKEVNKLATHPLSIAIEENSKNCIEILINKQEKIDWGYKEKTGDNFLHLGIFYGKEDIISNLIQNGVPTIDKNNRGLLPIHLAIDKGNQSLFDELHNITDLNEHYDETMIQKSIKSDNVTIFERLFPYSNENLDVLFDSCVGFQSVKVLSSILNEAKIILGTEQITKVIDMMCKNYSNKEDQEAAKKLADYLFDIGVPFNKFINEYGQSAWMLCVQNNNEDVFNKLMETQENVNIVDSEGHSPLFYAIEKNNEDFVKMLIKKKANTRQLDKQKNTPLIKAVQKNNYEMVKEIIKYTPMVNDVNLNNESALTIAIKNKRMDIVSELIWSGGEITTNPVKIVDEKHIFFFGADGKSERTAYSDEENIDNFIALAKLGLKLNQTNDQGDTFLLHFIKNGYFSNFTALMRCNFYPNQTDNDGNNALMCAAMKKQDEYFNAIINKFNNLDYSNQNKDGESVYDICFKVGKSSRMEKLLMADENINKENLIKVGKIIAKDGNIEKYSTLLNKKGLDLDFLDDNNNSLLVYAIMGKNIENFKFLVNEIGLDLNQKNKMGHTVHDILNSMPDDLSCEFKTIINHKNKKFY